ncbi:hypothetical protein Kisp01_23060 [Kineosporia sp. NBRC 101677]|nr:hypothetical protein Kisp01_23060 [Kineosporia sp. NBRC 101677]
MADVDAGPGHGEHAEQDRRGQAQRTQQARPQSGRHGLTIGSAMPDINPAGTRSCERRNFDNSGADT